jgi:hypothetical protein
VQIELDQKTDLFYYRSEEVVLGLGKSKNTGAEEMEHLKKTMELILATSVKTATAFLVAKYFPTLLNRARSTLGIVGGKLADWSWWMRESVPAL